MSDNQPAKQDLTAENLLAPGGVNVKLIYVLYLAGAIVAVTPLIGVIMAYINRGQASGWVESHYTYLIRTFWIGLLYSLISVVLAVVAVGFLLMLAVVIWFIVRCIRGLQWAFAGQPVPDPTTWLV